VIHTETVHCTTRIDAGVRVLEMLDTGGSLQDPGLGNLAPAL